MTDTNDTTKRTFKDKLNDLVTEYGPVALVIYLTLSTLVMEREITKKCTTSMAISWVRQRERVCSDWFLGNGRRPA